MYAAVSVGFTALILTFSDFFGKFKIFRGLIHSFDVIIVPAVYLFLQIPSPTYKT